MLQRHLEKFGARKELVVTWGPGTTEPDEVAEPAAGGVAAGAETSEPVNSES